MRGDRSYPPMKPQPAGRRPSSPVRPSSPLPPSPSLHPSPRLSPSAGHPSRGRKVAYGRLPVSADGNGLLFLSLAVFFLLLLSTADVVWLQRGDGFSGAGSFDTLAAFKLGARLVAVAFGGWLFLLTGPGLWLWKDPAVRWFSVFFVFAAGTAVYSAVPVVTLTRALSFLGVLFFVVVQVRYFSDQGRFQELWEGVYLVLGLHVALVFGLSVVFDAMGLGSGSGKRLATLYGPNGAGSLSGLLLVWSFVRFFRQEHPRLALLFGGVAGLFLVLTLSRGALGLTLVTCAAYALWRRRGVLSLAAGAGGLGLVVLIASVGEGGVSDLLAFLTRDQSAQRLQAMNGRIPLYTYLLTEQFPQFPWFGVGFQMLSESSLVVDLPTDVAVRRGSWYAGHAHNGLLHILIGTGMVGLSLFVCAWAFVFRGLRRLRLAAPSAWEVSVPLVFFLAAHAMVETTLTGTVDPNFLLLSLIVGGIAATWQRPAGPPMRVS